MKKIVFILLLFFTFIPLKTQTHIPGGDVSGTWTHVNSPYLINGDVEVPNAETLIIEPGVVVVFQGTHYGFTVSGQLLSCGNSSEEGNILFTANIRWDGIGFHETCNENGISEMNYCTINSVTQYLSANPLSIMSSNVAICNTVITDCHAWTYDFEDEGGYFTGIYINDCSPYIKNCKISDIDAGTNEFGDGVAFGIEVRNGNPTIVNSSISMECANNLGNYNEAFHFVNSEGILLNCIAYDGLRNVTLSNSSPSIVNSILYSTSSLCSIMIYGDSSPNVTYCNILDGWPGEGNIDSDPLFIDPENGNYQLLSNSPCINTGTPDTTGLNLPEYDLAGNPRIYDDRIDMGCYEWQGVAVDDEIVPIPTITKLFSNFPNPFNPSTTISYSISEKDKNKPVTLNIYNIKGQRVREFEIINDKLEMNEVVWNGTDEFGKPVSSGIYFYQMKMGDKSVATKKCLLLK